MFKINAMCVEHTFEVFADNNSLLLFQIRKTSIKPIEN
jgi:hypothetical protein